MEGIELSVIREAIGKIQNGFPSIYSKEDVVAILKELDERLSGEDGGLPKSSGASIDVDRLLSAIKEQVENEVDNMSVSDVVDLNSCSYEIKGSDTVQVDEDSVTVETTDIVRNVMDGVRKGIDEYLNPEE